MSDYDNFFDGVGGGGAPGFKFNGVGSGVKGTVVDQYQTVVTDPSGNKKTYSDGQEIPQLNVTLQTELRNWDNCSKVPVDETGKPKPASEDDGQRRIFVKYDMRRAVAVALRAAKAPGGLKNGATLAVKQTGAKPTGKGNDLPLYEARYEAPAAGDEFFATAKTAEPAPFTGSGEQPPF